MTEAPTQCSVASRTIAVEHIRISSGRLFAEVRRKLEATIPKLDTSIAEALGKGDQKRVKDYDEKGPKLSIFVERDHGALLHLWGDARQALWGVFEYDKPSSFFGQYGDERVTDVGTIWTTPWKQLCTGLPSDVRIWALGGHPKRVADVRFRPGFDRYEEQGLRQASGRSGNRPPARTGFGGYQVVL
jgi:hypothetical protein